MLLDLGASTRPEVVVSTGTEVLGRSFGCDGPAMDILRSGRRLGAFGGDGGTRAGELVTWSAYSRHISRAFFPVLGYIRFGWKVSFRIPNILRHKSARRCQGAPAFGNWVEGGWP